MASSAVLAPRPAASTSGRRVTPRHLQRHVVIVGNKQIRTRGMKPLQAQEDGSSATKSRRELSYRHLMVTLFDSNPYLAEGSRQALLTAAGLAAWNNSKVTVVVVDDEGKAVEEETKMKLTTINDLLMEKGCSNFSVIEKVTTENHSALVGDVADDIEADLVLLSSDCVHENNVDANLLAEFCSCATLMVP